MINIKFSFPKEIASMCDNLIENSNFLKLLLLKYEIFFNKWFHSDKQSKYLDR